MLDLFKSVGTLLRVKKIHIEGPIFRLHSTLTVLILLVFAIAGSARQIWGDPIYCDADQKAIDVNVLNNYCYLRSTYSLVDADRVRVAYFGLGHSFKPEHQFYHTYYQWVWCILLLQAICFYFPRWLWKSYESDKMSSLASKLDYFIDNEEDIESKISKIVNYFVKTNGTNNQYVIQYFLCEFMALFNVILQILLLNLFFNGKFLSLGFEVIRFQYDTTQVFPPLERVFPILSQCNYSRYGISGSPEDIYVLCFLSNNVIHQKIFLFLWFWYMILVILSLSVIIFRLVLILCPLMRYQCCRYRFGLDKANGSRNQDLAELVVNELHLGDWFILFLMSYNIEPIVFIEILDKLVDKFIKPKKINDEDKLKIEINKEENV